MIAVTVEESVKDRYRQGAQKQVTDLCCPIDYDPRYLEVIPQEVIDRDYGCGDPSRYVKPGETVLDLGSGTGKICFIASQVVGPTGRVIGVDMTEEMLEVAERAAPTVAERLGFANVTFKRGRIQDLALDLRRMDEELEREPVRTAADLFAAEAKAARLRVSEPMIATDSVDVVVSNCVLNLVEQDARAQLFREIYRVLKRGGRAVVSDIVADEAIPQHLKDDPELWSGCISGAFTETGFLGAFEEAGFHGIRVLERESEPWRTVDGIELRSVVVEAYKGKEGVCLERNQAVIYRGPFKEVLDDDGHRMERGKRYAVCEKTFNLYGREPYCDAFDFIEPRQEVPASEAALFDCSRTLERHPKETKGQSYDATTEAVACCEPGGSCC